MLYWCFRTIKTDCYCYTKICYNMNAMQQAERIVFNSIMADNFARGPVWVFLLFCIRSPLGSLLCFIIVFVITLCFTDEVKDHFADRACVCTLGLHRN